jgi:hypothetical protein
VPYWKTEWIFRFSAGAYHQPPFYKEVRDLEGKVHPETKAQKSYHLVAGSDYYFKMWGRPFKWTNEIYYKYMTDIIPYEIQNVQIRYYGENLAKAYAVGFDSRINGEFVKGVESWFTFSLMKTMEDIQNDYYYTYINSDGEEIIPGYTFNNIPVDSIYHEPGYIPRWTDQRVGFSIYFQDYIPKKPDFQFHINMIFNSSLPFGPPDHERYKDTLRMPPYRRVDIGVSKEFSVNYKEKKPFQPFRHFKKILISLEVFNLLQTRNTINYLWVKDVFNRSYAVPNYLTSRRINFKIIIEI